MEDVIQLLRQAKGLIEGAERRLIEQAQPEAAASAEGGYGNPQSPASYLRWYRALWALQQEGPDGVDADRQRELLFAAGYDDNRAGGGFFSGQRPSFRRDPVTDRRYLTEVGAMHLQDGLLRFGDAVKTLPRLAAN
jgi:hypothetical protein